MRSLRLTLTAVAIAAVAVLSVGEIVGAGGRPFRLELTGAEEAPPNPHGNADRGSVVLTLNQGQGEVCFSFGPLVLTAGEPLPFAAHIHEAPRGEPGDIVVTLFTPATAPTSYPTETRCVEADPDLIKEIRQNPEDYYVNAHNQTHPSGVVRAQLK